jgi:hypothetical protein
MFCNVSELRRLSMGFINQVLLSKVKKWTSLEGCLAANPKKEIENCKKLLSKSYSLSSFKTYFLLPYRLFIALRASYLFSADVRSFNSFLQAA